MGRLRLRREGGNIYAYYWGWENSRWEYAGDPNGYLIISGLRSGGNIADLAILMVDINEGLMPQTVESIEILKNEKLDVSLFCMASGTEIGEHTSTKKGLIVEYF